MWRPTAAYHDKFKDKLGFKDCHVRELGIYALPDPRLKSYIPQIYDCYKNLDREAFVVVMEDLSGLELMNTADNVSGWTREHVGSCYRWVGRAAQHWSGSRGRNAVIAVVSEVMTSETMVELIPLWRSLIDHAAEEFAEWFEWNDKSRVMARVHEIPEWWPIYESLHAPLFTTTSIQEISGFVATTKV